MRSAGRGAKIRGRGREPMGAGSEGGTFQGQCQTVFFPGSVWLRIFLDVDLRASIKVAFVRVD